MLLFLCGRWLFENFNKPSTRLEIFHSNNSQNICMYLYMKIACRYQPYLEGKFVKIHNKLIEKKDCFSSISGYYSSLQRHIPVNDERKTQANEIGASCEYNKSQTSNHIKHSLTCWIWYSKILYSFNFWFSFRNWKLSVLSGVRAGCVHNISVVNIFCSQFSRR